MSLLSGDKSEVESIEDDNKDPLGDEIESSSEQIVIADSKSKLSEKEFPPRLRVIC